MTSGGTPGPDWRKCTVYRQAGPGGLPLGLASTEGLGLACQVTVPGVLKRLDLDSGDHCTVL